LESDKISETEAATKNVELEMEESKGSPKHGRVEDEEDKNSDVEECDSVNVSHGITIRVFILIRNITGFST
jgi:hypothetical protein